MGTRHLIQVKKDNEIKIAQYGQWDGYLTGQGFEILEFLSNKENIEKLKEKISNVRFFDKEKDKDFLESYDKNSPEWSSDPDNRTEEQKDWFDSYITRDLGAKILYSIINSNKDEILLKDSRDFLEDTSFCEFAYELDLDNNKLKILLPFKKEYDFEDLPTKKDFEKLENSEEE